MHSRVLNSTAGFGVQHQDVRAQQHNWRPCSGSNRLSCHSLPATVGQKQGKVEVQKQAVLRNISAAAAVATDNGAVAKPGMAPETSFEQVGGPTLDNYAKASIKVWTGDYIQGLFASMRVGCGLNTVLFTIRGYLAYAETRIRSSDDTHPLQ